MKFLTYSDAQFNQWKEFSHILSNGRNSRFQDQLDAQNRIFEAAISEHVDLVVHCGDLYESLTEKIDKTTFLGVYESFMKFSESGIPVILVTGNHDWVDRTENNNILYPFKEIPNIVVVDKPMLENLGDCNLLFIPFTRKVFKESVKIGINWIKANSLKNKYLFVHQGVSGAAVGSRDVILKEEYSVGDFEPDFFNVIFGGHFHKSQILGKNFIIVGSMLQKDFGEREDKKGYLILDTSKSPNEPVFIENTLSPKFFKIGMKDVRHIPIPKDFSEKDFLWVRNENPDYTYEQLFKILSFVPNKRIEKISVDSVVKPRTELSVSMPVEEQLKTYVNFVKPVLDVEKVVSMGVDKWKRSI